MLDNFRAKSVTILKTIWHQIINIAAAHAAQGKYRQCGTGGTISIKVTDNHNALPIGQRLLQQCDSGINAIKLLPRQ